MASRPQQRRDATAGAASFAKTTRPSTTGVLDRERLFTRLDRDRHCPSVWVAGPPGSGKTTLLASYLATRGPDALWYQLDGGDVDPASFFYYLGLAFAAHRPAEAGNSLPLFTPEYHANLAAFSRRYFQRLYLGFDSSFVLVFDNYQVLPATASLHEVMREAVSEMPAHGSVMVCSREEPPASMIRLRANRRMKLLGWKELRLTRKETTEIVALRGVKLAKRALDRLCEQTQGWAAGLTLMLDQAETDAPRHTLPDLSKPQLVFDYLAGELFQTLDGATQQFLLASAFLSQMTAAMARELTADENADEILTALHRRYHFVTLRPGDPEPLYEYHPLLRAFLLNRAQTALSSERLLEVRRACAGLLERLGDVDQALALLRGVEDWEAVRALILAQAPAMTAHGRAETLLGWIDELPEEMHGDDPWLAFWSAACSFPAHPRRSRLLYETAYRRFEADAARDTEGLALACAGVIDSIVYELDDLSLLDGWITLLRGLLSERGSALSAQAEAQVTSSLFVALLLRQPHHEDIEHWVVRALDVSKENADPNLRVSVGFLIGVAFVWTGQFERSLAVIESLRALVQTGLLSPLSATTVKFVESMFHMWQPNREACLEAVSQGVEIAEASGVHLWVSHLYGNGVAAALAGGDFTLADELLDKMNASDASGGRVARCFYHYYRAWRAMLEDDALEALRENKTALRFAVEGGCPYFELLCRLALAQVLIRCGDERRAVGHLRQVHTAARNIKNRLMEFMCLLGYAHIALEHGRERSGLNSLRYAFALGREHGYTHFLGWQPGVMARLCERALENDIEVDYAKKLIRERELTPEQPPLHVARWPWDFKIHTLGPFRVQKHDQSLGLVSKLQRKPLELLKALVAYGGVDVNEETLADALWPRIDADYAHRSLTTNLHRLRKLLGADQAVLLRHGRLSLNPELCWLDVWAFEALPGGSENGLHDSHGATILEEVRRLAERALSLYRGPFMSGESEQSWYLPTRERLRNRFLRCISELARCFEDADDWQSAADYYERSLEVDAVSEGFYRRLMVCYRELGRKAELMETYERCRKTLGAALKIEPSRETTAVYHSLVEEI